MQRKIVEGLKLRVKGEWSFAGSVERYVQRSFLTLKAGEAEKPQRHNGRKQHKKKKPL